MNDDYTTPLASKGGKRLNLISLEGYIDEDAKKSMAIVNLQAIIGEDDVDKVIALLEQNNWDESVTKSD